MITHVSIQTFGKSSILETESCILHQLLVQTDNIPFFIFLAHLAGEYFIQKMFVECQTLW